MLRKGNLIIVGTCFMVLLAEWSAPGQLRFRFPFISQPLQQFAEVPKAVKKMVPPSKPQPSPVSTKKPGLSAQDRSQLKKLSNGQ